MIAESPDSVVNVTREGHIVVRGQIRTLNDVLELARLDAKMAMLRGKAKHSVLVHANKDLLWGQARWLFAQLAHAELALGVWKHADFPYTRNEAKALGFPWRGNVPTGSPQEMLFEFRFSVSSERSPTTMLEIETTPGHALYRIGTRTSTNRADAIGWALGLGQIDVAPYPSVPLKEVVATLDALRARGLVAQLRVPVRVPPDLLHLRRLQAFPGRLDCR